LSRVDLRFEQVDVHIVEQRAYVEFAYSRLEKTITQRFDRFERKLDRLIVSRPSPRRRR
jgi:hypothetical protein